MPLLADLVKHIYSGIEVVITTLILVTDFPNFQGDLGGEGFQDGCHWRYFLPFLAHFEKLYMDYSRACQ